MRRRREWERKRWREHERERRARRRTRKGKRQKRLRLARRQRQNPPHAGRAGAAGRQAARLVAPRHAALAVRERVRPELQRADQLGEPHRFVAVEDVPLSDAQLLEA